MQQVKKTHKLFLKLISLLIKSFILNQFMQVFSFYIIYGSISTLVEKDSCGFSDYAIHQQSC
jgi:hypothetical protein